MKKYDAVFEDFLRTKSLKMTSPRKIILEAVFKTHNHFDVDSLYDIIREKHSNVSRATIYRTIPLLIEAGLVKQSLRCQAKDQYENTYGQKRHLHFLCIQCGKIIETESDEVEKLLADLAKIEKFVIKDYNLGAKGLCADCKKKMKMQDNNFEKI